MEEPGEVRWGTGGGGDGEAAPQCNGAAPLPGIARGVADQRGPRAGRRRRGNGALGEELGVQASEVSGVRAGQAERRLGWGRVMEDKSRGVKEASSDRVRSEGRPLPFCDVCFVGRTWGHLLAEAYGAMGVL